MISPLAIIVLIVAITFGIIAYVIEGLTLYRMGKKAGVTWAWVAWIPGAQNFVVARMARWKAWALFPILTLFFAGLIFPIGIGGISFSVMSSIHHLSHTAPLVAPMHSAPGAFAHSAPPIVAPMLFPAFFAIMPFVEGISILLSVFTMVQFGQVLERFGYSYAWLMWNFLPVIGYIVFFVILFRIAFRKDVQYQDSGMRTMFGSQIRKSGNSI